MNLKIISTAVRPVTREAAVVTSSYATPQSFKEAFCQMSLQGMPGTVTLISPFVKCHAQSLNYCADFFVRVLKNANALLGKLHSSVPHKICSTFIKTDIGLTTSGARHSGFLSSLVFHVWLMHVRKNVLMHNTICNRLHNSVVPLSVL